MPLKRCLEIAIVGGGASGALLAAHLLRGGDENTYVTMIEPREEIGRGLAYSTGNPRHLLNVRATNMSAFADDPGHFRRWLEAEGQASEERFYFAPRSLYGRYLGGLLAAYLDKRKPRRLSLLRDLAVRIVKAEGLRIELASGAAVEADIVVLACGHEGSDAADPLYLSPWTEPVGGGAPPNAGILILGTGLTMVDAALSLRDAGHSGPIVAVSRRGLLPQTHRHVEALALDGALRPSGAELAKLSQWLRSLATDHMRRGGDWRSVMDGLRPYVQTIWREMPVSVRQRFLEHARPWWDTHRHRMAPLVEANLRSMIAEGHLKIVAGKVSEIVPTKSGARVSIRQRSDDGIVTYDVARIVSCRGLTNDPRKSVNPIVRNLLSDGLARVDALGIGFDVGADCGVINRSGGTCQGLFAIGPMSQAAFWEITAIPDIRLQAGMLANRLKELASPASRLAQRR
jgi:uncharacterized NAD(P)/FAD-binding protein YdhS